MTMFADDLKADLRYRQDYPADHEQIPFGHVYGGRHEDGTVKWIKRSDLKPLPECTASDFRDIWGQNN